MPAPPGRAEIVYLRSSAHPVVYALVLGLMRDDGWEAACCMDNSHQGRDGVDPHHAPWMSDHWEDFI